MCVYVCAREIPLNCWIKHYICFHNNDRWQEKVIVVPVIVPAYRTFTWNFLLFVEKANCFAFKIVVGHCVAHTYREYLNTLFHFIRYQLIYQLGGIERNSCVAVSGAAHIYYTRFAITACSLFVVGLLNFLCACIFVMTNERAYSPPKYQWRYWNHCGTVVMSFSLPITHKTTHMRHRDTITFKNEWIEKKPPKII